MRVAIVSQFTSPGGGARFLRGLCLGLLDQSEIAEIGLFIHSADAVRDEILSLLPQTERLTLHLMNGVGGFADEPTSPPVRVTSVRTLRQWARDQLWLVRPYRWVRRLDRKDAAALQFSGTEAAQAAEIPAIPRVTLSEAVVAAIGAYDVAYLPWPRQIVPPAQPPALVATFHDFNHRHRFGNFREQDVRMLDAEMVEWLEGRVQPICSTPFIAGELNEYYPGRTNDPAIVYLSTFAIHDPDPGDVEQVRARFGLPQSYILCPTNIGPHKNLISLIRAAGEMKRSGIPFALVLTGSGTQCLGVDPTGEPLYQSIFHDHIDLLNDTLLQEDLLPGRDFWALGYVSDEEMDALVKGATLVAAPSRYEAGSGPALDAWWLGTGVVSSSLQPVLEQIEFLGTEAMLFDATDVNGMAEALTSALTYPEAIAEMAARSQDAMKRYTWSDVARGYVGVFRGAVEAAARYEAMREAIATRLRDRVARDPDVLLALCRLDPGFVADEARLPREKRGLRATVRGIPVLGSLVYSAHTLLRGERGPGDG